LKEKGDAFVLGKEQLVDHQLSYFTKLAETNHGLSEDVMSLFWSAKVKFKVNIEPSGAYQLDWRFEPNLTQKMKQYLNHKDPKEFLKGSINYGFRESGYASIYPQFIDIFSTPEEFKNIVEKNKELDDDIKQEYLQFFDRCQEVSFSHQVQMEFKTELKSVEST
jgi:hypothetical protein